MHNRSAVQLRVALSAAAIFAVLAAATLSGAHPDASRTAGTARQMEPILAKSISTVMNPVVGKTGASHDPS
ncbi:MAG: hypothetical protein WB647_04895, partial [Roseiarcus sp.]|uniref:hypothetical protein n=1 Tax=Roseiarcus sp. TaxID=1969460 RepID=UPI003C63D300